MDVEELKQTIEALRQALEDAPGRINELQEELRAFQGDVLGVADTLRQGREEAEKLIAELEAALVPVQETTTGGAQTFASDRGSLPEPEVIEEITIAIGPAEESLHDATDRVDALQERLATVAQQAGSAVTNLGEELEASREALAGVQDVATAAANGLAERLAAVREDLTLRVEALVQALDDRQVDTLSRLDALLQALGDARGTLAARLDEARESTLREGTDRLLDVGAERASEAEQRLDHALETLGDALRAAETAMHDAEAEAASGTESLEPLFAELGRRLGPMRSALASLREAADEVGFAM